MNQSGLIEEGMTLVHAVRDRYDGEKRTPWSKIECGSNYARAMASYSLLNTFSGFQFDLVNGFIGFDPITQGHDGFRCFWALDGAWGEVVYTADTIELRILSGSLQLRSCDFGVSPANVQVDGEKVPWELENGTLIRFGQETTARREVAIECKLRHGDKVVTFL